jgi:hypothetical protein
MGFQLINLLKLLSPMQLNLLKLDDDFKPLYFFAFFRGILTQMVICFFRGEGESMWFHDDKTTCVFILQ